MQTICESDAQLVVIDVPQHVRKGIIDVVGCAGLQRWQQKYKLFDFMLEPQ